MGFKVYLDYLSQPCRAVRLFLEQNEIEYEEQIVSIGMEENRTDWFSKINPLKKLPVLDHDGFILMESAAIMKYLSKEARTPDHWYPSDVTQRARYDEFVAWQHSTIRRYGSLVFCTAAFAPWKYGKPVDEELLKIYAGDLEKFLNLMENYFLGRSKFLVTDLISIADLTAVSELYQPLSVGFDVTRNRPKLAAWLERVREDLGQQFDLLNRDIFGFSANYKRDNFAYDESHGESSLLPA